MAAPLSRIARATLVARALNRGRGAAGMRRDGTEKVLRPPTGNENRGYDTTKPVFPGPPDLSTGRVARAARACRQDQRGAKRVCACVSGPCALWVRDERNMGILGLV